MLIGRYPILIALVSILVLCPSLANAAQEEPGRAIEISSLGLKWSDSKLPPAAVKALSQSIQDSRIAGHFWIDVDGDGKKELIVANAEHFSGGRIYVILRERKGAWKEIAEIQGGFSMSLLESKDNYYVINSYYRSGDTYQNVCTYSKDRYRLTNQVLLPRALTQSRWWDSFWNDFNSP